jgi:FkbM family methyltransferase
MIAPSGADEFSLGKALTDGQASLRLGEQAPTDTRITSEFSCDFWLRWAPLLLPFLLLIHMFGNPCCSLRVVIYRLLPNVNCRDYPFFPDIWYHSDVVLKQIKAIFNDSPASSPVLAQWLDRFRPDNLYGQQVLHTLKMQLAVGLSCWRLYNRAPPLLSAYLSQYTSSMQAAEANKYHNMSNSCPEVFLFHHGLRFMDPRIRAKLKTKDFLDIGAYTGDSALVLSQYAKDVYSIELSAVTFKKLNVTLTLNPALSSNVHPIHAGVSDYNGYINYSESGASESVTTRNPKDDLVEIFTIDTFVQKNRLSVGFLKADVEGAAYKMVRGAVETLLRDRPVFSISVYHDFVEMYNASTWLMDLLPNYYFEWHMENPFDFAFYELSLFGRPREL